MNARALFTASMLFLSLLIGTASAQQEERSLGSTEDRFSAAAVAAWEKRSEAIKQELSELQDHPWAGSYYSGIGTGLNLTLTLAPKNGFVLVDRGCMGVTSRNYGEVTMMDKGLLRLTFAFENRYNHWGVAAKLLPVPWGERRYLISPDDMVDFCNKINSELEPREDLWSSPFLRPGDEKKPVTGYPKLPKKYQGFLLKEPIEAEIIAVHETETGKPCGEFNLFYRTKVDLNVGRSQKVFRGMSFGIRTPQHARLGITVVRVVNVGERNSQACVGHATELLRPEIGWSLTTGNPWRSEYAETVSPEVKALEGPPPPAAPRP